MSRTNGNGPADVDVDGIDWGAVEAGDAEKKPEEANGDGKGHAAAGGPAKAKASGGNKSDSSGAPGEKKAECPHLATTCLAGIQPEPVRWLVPKVIPLGKLVLVAGDGGHCKSTLTLHLAARLSRGLPCFGLKYDPLLPAESLLVSCEDDFADTVVPRLLSAGADLDRIHRVDGVAGKDGKVLPFNLSHYLQMEQELKRRPLVRLVVIDPAGAYIGRSGVDDHKDSELRSLLGPMTELAAGRRVTFILVKHLNKGATVRAVEKVGGSTGYVNAVRAAFLVAPNPEDGDQKFFLPIKFNLGPRPRGISFRTEPLSPPDRQGVIRCYGSELGAADQEELAKQLFRIQWGDPTDADADAVLRDAARQERGPSKVDQAAEWLLKFLAQYAYPSSELDAASREEGFTFDNLNRAKRKIGKEKIRASNRGAFQGVWWWGPGDPKTWVLRPVPWKPKPSTPDTPDLQDLPDSGEEEPDILSLSP